MTAFSKSTLLIFVMCYRLMKVESFCFLRDFRFTWFIPHFIAAYYLLFFSEELPSFFCEEYIFFVQLLKIS